MSLEPSEERAVRDAVRQARRGVPKPDLALVFGGALRDQRRLHRALSRELDPAILIGGTSYAEITNAGVTQGSVAVLLLSLPGARVSFASAANDGDPLATGRTLAASLPKAADPAVRRLALILTAFATGREGDMARGFDEGGGAAPLFGGMCAGDYDSGLSSKTFWNNWQYAGPELKKRAARAALLELPRADYDLAFGFAHGWQPVGPVMTVTKAEGHRVFELDGQPVLDVYRQLLGGESIKDFFELLVQRYGFRMEGGAGAARLKLPVSYDLKAGTVELFPAEDMVGAKLRFLQSSRRGAVSGAREAAEACAKALGGRKPGLVLLVSCCTRKLLLNQRMDSEVDAVRSAFGPGTPVFGYYSGGELLPTASRWEDAMTGPGAGSFYHVTTIGMLAIAPRRRARVVQPKRRPAVQDMASLAAALAAGEATLDTSETILTNMSHKSVRDAEKLRSQTDVIRRYTPHQVFQRVGENAEKGVYELADATFDGAFMFMDVKGFTAYSETHKPAQVVAAVNRIFDPCVKAIYATGGDVDKFIGDCIFAAFPSPRSAAEAACAVWRAVERERAGGSPFLVRVGVNAGRAVRANVGSAARREYTFIGDAVNLTQRLEANATPGRLLLSEAVYAAGRELFGPAERKVITVKNRTEPVTAYECVPIC